MNTEGWGDAVRDGLAEGVRRAEDARRSPHNPWPDGIINALDMPYPDPQTALARWDSAEISTGRQVQPLVEDQTRFCLHPSSDHGTLGCNTCGCPRSEDDHLGELCRWPEAENAKAREPWLWRPGMHMERYPHGMVFQHRKVEPQAFRPWTGSIADLMDEPRNNLGTLAPLDSQGVPQDGGLELLGPFHMRYEDGRLAEFIAWGGVSRDLQLDAPDLHAPVLEGLGMRITKYNADGTLGESVHFVDARVSVTMRDVDLEEDSALKRLVRAWGPPVAQLAITFTQTVGPVCRALLDALTGLHPFKGHTGKVPPCRGLTRRQRSARRRIHRRRNR